MADDDLVKRLRAWGYKDCVDAADRIEELERQLATNRQTHDNVEASYNLVKRRAEKAEKQLAAARAEIGRKDTLFDAISHGDQEHRDWLKQAISDHFLGRAVERPRGMGTTEHLIKLVTEARNKLHAHNRPNLPGKLRLEVRDLLDEALAAPVQGPSTLEVMAKVRDGICDELEAVVGKPLPKPHHYKPDYRGNCRVCGHVSAHSVHRSREREG